LTHLQSLIEDKHDPNDRARVVVEYELVKSCCSKSPSHFAYRFDALKAIIIPMVRNELHIWAPFSANAIHFLKQECRRSSAVYDGSRELWSMGLVIDD
jgi:hypothetical protein